MSLYMTEFTRPSPALVLQATNAGVRRPGYEATVRALQCGTLRELKIVWYLRDLMGTWLHFKFNVWTGKG